MAPDLPIDAQLATIVRGLAQHHRGVLVAEPGADKTTAVPPPLCAALPAGQIWVLQPRRLAARLAAQRVAQSLGQVEGDSVG